MEGHTVGIALMAMYECGAYIFREHSGERGGDVCCRALGIVHHTLWYRLSVMVAMISWSVCWRDLPSRTMSHNCREAIVGIDRNR